MAQGYTLENFKNESIAQVSVSKYTSNPQLNSWKDGGFLGECVSEINQYCWRVLDVPAGSWGDAVDWWTNSTVLTYFDQVTDGSRKDGDILVWGDDPGTFTGRYGHIAISYGGKILNQNYGNNRKVTINGFFTGGYLGALRLKGASMSISKDEAYKVVKWDYLHGTGVDPTGPQAEEWANAMVKNPAKIDELGKYMNDQVNKRIQAAYDKGKSEAGGNVPTGTYIKVDQSNVIEVK